MLTLGSTIIVCISYQTWIDGLTDTHMKPRSQHFAAVTDLGEAAKLNTQSGTWSLLN
jgi:hypothetical protein